MDSDARLLSVPLAGSAVSDARAAAGSAQERLCQEAWASLLQSRESLALPSELRSRLPLLYVSNSVDEIIALGKDVIVALCFEGDIDGLSVATLLRDTSVGLLLALQAAKTALADSDSNNHFPCTQVVLQRLERRLSSTTGLLVALQGTDQGQRRTWAQALSCWNMDELFCSGDLMILWRDNFPRQLRVQCDALAKVLHMVRGVDVRTWEKLLPWFQPDGGSCVELADLIIILDNLGLWRGIAFCTRWTDLASNGVFNGILNNSGRRKITSMTADDIVLSRRERRSSVLLPGWTREDLRTCRHLLLAFSALGLYNAGDTDAGLVVQLEDAAIAACLVLPPDEELSLFPKASSVEEDPNALLPEHPALTPLGETISALVQKSGSGGASISFENSFPKLVFDWPGEELISTKARSATISSMPSIPSSDPRPKKVTGTGSGASVTHSLEQLTALKVRKLWALHDFLRVFEVLDFRVRVGHEHRVHTCNPVFRSEAWPVLQQAYHDLNCKEHEVASRKGVLTKMEESSENQDQIAHIRTLLQDVMDAEGDLDTHKAWLAGQERKWIEEEREFQEDRRCRDLAARQRIAALLIEHQREQRRRCQVTNEVTRIEMMLVDVEETFSSGQERVHEYGKELTASIKEKDSLLVDLLQAVSVVSEAGLKAETMASESRRAKERLEWLAELQRERGGLQETIETLEGKLEAVKLKLNPLFVPARPF